MKMISQLSQMLRPLLNVQSLDPDDARRRKLLNILLLGTLMTAVLGLIITASVDIFNLMDIPRVDIVNLYIASVFTILICGVIFLINRHWSGRWAGFLFLLLTLAVAAFFDEPAQVIEGRSLLWFTIPILGGSMLMFPAFSFVMAVLSSLTIIAVGFSAQIIPSPIGMLGFFIIAMVSWLAARTMERALRDLRFLNEELDQRVQDRTRELAEALRREHTLAVRNKTILESIADGVLVFDADQSAVMANPAASRLARRDLQSLNLSEFLATIEGQARESIKGWLKGHQPDGMNHVKFEWHERTISANIAPVILPDGGKKQVGAGNVMVLRDFTKEAELEKAKDLFLGMVSHELRTPLTAIRGYVEILLERIKGQVSEEDYQFMQVVDVNAKRLLELANELVDLSRMEMGKMDIYCQWVDVAELVQNAVKIVRSEFEKRKLSLEIKCADNLTDLYADSSRITQVLLNLLSNAYKYTLEGGATVEVSQTDEWVNITVSDTGVGIKEADQDKLFQRFFRAGDRAIQRVEGTGLGLNISKGLIELHGGRLTFESEYGVGTTFNATLPKVTVPVE